jgi:predicted dehydrogenase
MTTAIPDAQPAGGARRPVRVALLGCGVVSEILADMAYPHLGDLATVVAAVDSREDRAAAFAARLGARPYTSLAAALAAEQVDAVDVRLPHPLHAAAALEAIAAGCHVMVEKPLATVLAVAENYEFLPALATARQLLDAGAVGPVLVARGQRICTVEGIWMRDGWRVDSRRGGGGVLLDQGCHQVHLLRHLLGEITHVHAYASDRHPSWHGEDSVVVNCRVAGGIIAQQLYCWGTSTPQVGAEAYVYGVEGSLEIHLTYGAPGGGVVVHRPDLPGGGRWELRGADYHDTFLPTLRDWLLACAGEKPAGMPGEDGLRDLAVVAAAYRSLETGAEVAVAEIEGDLLPAAS